MIVDNIAIVLSVFVGRVTPRKHPRKCARVVKSYSTREHDVSDAYRLVSSEIISAASTYLVLSVPRHVCAVNTARITSVESQLKRDDISYEVTKNNLEFFARL